MKARTCVVFGGSGYIGTKLAERLLQNKSFDRLYVFDLNPSGLAGERLVSRIADVRRLIEQEIDDFDPDSSWVVDLAAVHREPGHEPREYFDTNVTGAHSVTSFAERLGFKNLFFMSSIAPYGRSLEERTEASPLYAETPYGISKALAEKIHEVWLARDSARRVVICRPGVVYGPGDPGNMLRMIRALRRGTFVFPGPPSVVKAYGYVYGLVDSMEFVMAKTDRFIVYNYAEYPAHPLGELVAEIKSIFGIRRATPRIPMAVLVASAAVIQAAQAACGKAGAIHPMRVRKAAFPTNIKPDYLIRSGFEFKYDFSTSLHHWRTIAPADFA